MLEDIITSPGSPLPPGAHFSNNGVQFSLFSRHATGVTLVFFESGNPDAATKEIELDQLLNRTGDIWHIHITGITEGQIYGYRVDGPYDPKEGHRFNKNKLLLDPYARSITRASLHDLDVARGYLPESSGTDLSFSEIDSALHVPRSVLPGIMENNFSKHLNIPDEDYIIYELHVRGFTKHNSSGVSAPGSFRGLTEKIPYLKELGVNAVELMPVQEFNEDENININPLTGERLKNYWGYSTIGFFAPEDSYCSCGSWGEQITEFRKMTKAFHDAGIEIILDVVFNHTAEGDEKGPTLSFRGLDNSIYYILKEDQRFYKNYSGCGNTFNCNHPLVRDFILDALRYWVVEMHVDGFRFDLASILGRDQDGSILSNPPLIERIEEDPILRNTKIIAEAWDAAGAYQLGSFPGRWAEWNGRYRDNVRSFWRGDPGSAGLFATRLTGSSDLYYHAENGPFQSINFITCHDGFTLNDLVSYKEKHNIENGENNRDGENNNISANWGIEGPPRTELIDMMRKRQIKNLLATLFLSQGIPMLHAGDELRRTQRGNNNTYCQDNEISWIDWGLKDQNDEIYRFTRLLIAFRKRHPILRQACFLKGSAYNSEELPDIRWYGPEGGMPDWGTECRSLALCLNGGYAAQSGGEADSDIFIIFNSDRAGRYFVLPPSPGGSAWRLAINTASPGTEDIFDNDSGPILQEDRYFVERVSTVIFIAAGGPCS